jgi:hypothetical protein
MQHLFYLNILLFQREAKFSISGLTANIEIKESNIMLGIYGVMI